jgi:lipopolysaccharide/colanic/teichoic acid biosynthesis glycosyltransferase
MKRKRAGTDPRFAARRMRPILAAVDGDSSQPVPAASHLGDVLRRILDLAVACFALIVLWPFLLVIAWRIRRDSPGPAIFRQTRAGRGMRPFTLYKFRTMRADADPYGPSPHEAADPRLTPFGRWLREHSLDELPQIWNVLRGDMTLVGPRPLYVEQACSWTARQSLRLRVKPGLTGLAQVSGRAGLTIEDKLELDVEYVLRRSLRLDAMILARTLARLWRGGDIYEVRYSRDEERRGDARSP